LIAETEAHQQRFAERLEHILVALDDLPLAQILGDAMIARGMRLGLAESCTGGHIGHQITQISGSSNYFQGSLVCYQNEVKTGVLGVSPDTIRTQNVVSEAVALEMAAGARRLLGADLGFGITGMLSGDTDPDIAAGTICMGISAADRQLTRTFRFHLDRARNKELATNAALLLLWQFVEGKV
jgi:nicotinamide-nucleotide amidase